MKIIARYDDVTGNESVGSMWSETAIFNDIQPIKDIYKWIDDKRGVGAGKVNVILTIAEEIYFEEN